MKWISSLNVLLAASLFVPSARGQSSEQREDDRIAADTDAAAESVSPALTRVEQLMVQATNQFRQKHGRDRLKISDDLSGAAEYFARYMARTDEYGHTADGNRPSQRAENYGYAFCIVAENIAYLYRSRGFAQRQLTRQFVRGWIESPGHRENMLDRDVTEIGVAVAQSEESGNWYGVQMFGRPRSTMTRFTISNRSGERVRYSVGGRSFALPPRYTRTHERCRPTRIEWGWTDKDVSLEPTAGAHFIVQMESGGELTVRRRR